MRKWGGKGVLDQLGNPRDGAGSNVLPPHHAPQPHPHTHAHSHHQHQQMILGDSNGDDKDQEVVQDERVEMWVQDERAETWVQAEVKQALVGVDFIGDERKRVRLITHHVHR